VKRSGARCASPVRLRLLGALSQTTSISFQYITHHHQLPQPSNMAGDKPWPQAPVGNQDHSNAAVVIIGAGFSGLCMAIDLIKRNNCRNFVIIEKSAGLGGTW